MVQEARRSELADELFDDLLMDYVAIQIMNGENQETNGHRGTDGCDQ